MGLRQAWRSTRASSVSISIHDMPSGLVHTGLYTRVKYMASLPRPSLRKCGKRKLISKKASGYSFGMRSSLHTFAGGGIIGGAGIALLYAFGAVPPGVPTEPVRTTSSSRARATCQPPRLPAAVLRHTCVESAPRASPTARAISAILAEIFLPVDPAADELAVVATLAHEDVRDREQERRLGAGPRREPPVGHRR